MTTHPRLDPDPLDATIEPPLSPVRYFEAWDDGYEAARRDTSRLFTLLGGVIIGVVLAVVVGTIVGALAPRAAPDSSAVGHPVEGIGSGAARGAGTAAPPPAAARPSPAGGAPEETDPPEAPVGGIAAYALPSYGPRYLAIPEGPGHRVRICSQDDSTRCVTRTSTDAGPDLEMQRAGRIADLSYADFAYLCRCDPQRVGTMPVSIAYLGADQVTIPPTETQP